MQEAYEDVCRSLPKLCPRLVPAPLWSYSLAGFARLNPYVASAICDECEDIVRRLNYFWFGQKEEQCEVCGGEGKEVDEDWRYYVESNKGIAMLGGLRTLCEKCHLAKHQGYARIKHQDKEALIQLAKVNGVEKVESLVEKTFMIHMRLSYITDWEFRLDAIEEPLRSMFEKLLNTAYKRGFRYERGWLFYTSKKALELESRSLRVSKEVMEKGEDLLTLAISSLSGIEVLEKEFKVFLDMISDKLKLVSLVEDEEFLTASLSESLSGKWMVFVRKEIYPRFFSALVDRLGDLGYMAKITNNVENRDLPVIVYVPSVFDFELVMKVKDVIRSVMREFEVEKSIFFKPDVFTDNNIYSGRSDIRPYIFVA